MGKILSTILILLLNLSVYGQQDSLKLKLYKLEREIILGNSESLREMAFYLDDTTSILEFLGYHRYPNSARGITMRILSENCLIEDEIRFDSTLSAQKFLKLVTENNFKYDDLTGMFINSPLSRRKISYKLREVSDYDLKGLDSIINSLPHPNWYYENQIDLFIANKDPQALLWIASAWYKKRSRFNSYYFNDEEFLDLIKFFTKMDLGVTDDHGNITFLYKDDFYAHARLNFLTYWIQHYKDYKWDDNKKYFINIFESPSARSKEETLFELLTSENDSIAISAFTQLTEMDTGNVKVLSKAYQRNSVDVNFKLPTFPFKFLQQMVSLTQYCRDNNIDYKLSGWLLDSINRLKSEMPLLTGIDWRTI
jgi:hypothetical protein